MAHKTLIGGTAYEIDGGKTLIGGTAYSIDKGKTLVGGTAYEVGFDDGMRTITITDTNSSYNSSTHSQYAYITHNGVDYIDSTTFNAKIGDVIRCTVGASGGGSAQIIVNGTHVVSKPVSGIFEQTTYEYEIVSDVTINLQRIAGSRGSTFGYITITET